MPQISKQILKNINKVVNIQSTYVANKIGWNLKLIAKKSGKKNKLYLEKNVQFFFYFYLR